jgi:serine/threonine-protein kinase ULK4
MNNYHIYEEIGRGKFSIVYKGRKKKTIEYMAVKSVEKSRRKKVLNEVKIMHNLIHPNILRFYNWYETRNHLWVLFEYCCGGNLSQLIEQDKKAYP